MYESLNFQSFPVWNFW